MMSVYKPKVNPEREFIVNHFKISGKGVVGCKRHKKDFMITVINDDGDYIDIFFDDKMIRDMSSQLNQLNRKESFESLGI